MNIGIFHKMYDHVYHPILRRAHASASRYKTHASRYKTHQVREACVYLALLWLLAPTPSKTASNSSDNVAASHNSARLADGNDPSKQDSGSPSALSDEDFAAQLGMPIAAPSQPLSRREEQTSGALSFDHDSGGSRSNTNNVCVALDRWALFVFVVHPVLIKRLAHRMSAETFAMFIIATMLFALLVGWLLGAIAGVRNWKRAMPKISTGRRAVGAAGDHFPVVRSPRGGGKKRRGSAGKGG